MQLFFNQYDASFAIGIRSIMLYEPWQGNEQRREEVWLPTQKWLDDFAQTRPETVNYFLGKELNGSGNDVGKRRNVFIVNHQDELAYLCTVFSNKAFFHRARNSERKPFKRLILKPIRDHVYYIMAAKAEVLSKAAIANSIRRYLRSYKETPIPSLADAKINFLSEEDGMKLDTFILAEAEKLAEE